jgi:glycosyltransferase involved in cell wall biosynthesis
VLFRSDADDPSRDPAVSEVLYPTARSLADRLRAIPAIVKTARAANAALWHIHDLYLVPWAKRWRRKTGRPVIFDVHEYYGLDYAAKFPLPQSLRRRIANGVDRYQMSSASDLGAVNVATAGIAPIFRASNVPVIVTPNAPLGEPFLRGTLKPFSSRVGRVIHIGTMNQQYGMRRLVQIASAAHRRGLPHRFDFVDRFHNDDERRAYRSLFADQGSPPNVRLIPAVPPHLLADLLGDYGIGLAVFSRSGQNDRCTPGKLFEYALMGLAIVATDAPAQRRFIGRWAVSRSCAEENIEDFVDAIEQLTSTAKQLDSEVADRASFARGHLTWENCSSPALSGLYRLLT